MPPTKEVFFIPDHGKTEVPFEDLHYWKYLEQNPEVHFVTTKIRYLKSLGFDRERHLVYEGDMNLLRGAEQMFGWRRHQTMKQEPWYAKTIESC